jgi:25S rRNA (cytosine2278-C5)-methyltransferase
MTVTTILTIDFTLLDPNDERFANVTHILLDPSCSGSGLLDRFDFDTSGSDLPTRLRNLSTFQTRLLRHALSFPAALWVVYSTCSQYAEENERVVNTVLEQCPEWRVLRRDEQPEGLRQWHRRGLPEECPSMEIAEGCIRTEKGTDATIGFFTVAFTRITYLTEDDDEEWQGIPNGV